MEEAKRKKKFLIAALVCLGLALVWLVPGIILSSGIALVGIIS